MMGLRLVLQGTRMNSHQLLGASHSVGWDQQPWVPIVTSPSMPSVSRWWHRRGEEIVSLSPLWPLGHKQAAPRRALQCPEVQPDLLPCSGVLHMSPPELGQEGTITVSLGPSWGLLNFCHRPSAAVTEPLSTRSNVSMTSQTAPATGDKQIPCVLRTRISKFSSFNFQSSS